MEMRGPDKDAEVPWCRLSIFVGYVAVVVREGKQDAVETSVDIEVAVICRMEHPALSIISRYWGAMGHKLKEFACTSVKLVIVVADYRGIMIGSFHSALPRSVDPSSVCTLPSHSPFSLSTKLADVRHIKTDNGNDLARELT